MIHEDENVYITRRGEVRNKRLARKTQRKLHVVEFLYADNDQLYQTFAWLTKAEAEIVEAYMNALKKHGDILGTSEGANFCWEWKVKGHRSLRGLVKEFGEVSSFDYAREDGIVLALPKKGTHANKA